jgi:hypothetical protein
MFIDQTRNWNKQLIDQSRSCIAYDRPWIPLECVNHLTANVIDYDTNMQLSQGVQISNYYIQLQFNVIFSEWVIQRYAVHGFPFLWVESSAATRYVTQEAVLCTVCY